MKRKEKVAEPVQDSPLAKIVFWTGIQTTQVPAQFLLRTCHYWMDHLSGREDPEVHMASFYASTGNAYLPHLRDNAVRVFLEIDPELATHLLMCDCDMVWPKGAIGRMARADKPVISARCHMRASPYASNARALLPDGRPRFIHPEPHDGLTEVGLCGAGFMLVKREVFEAVAEISDSWFTPPRDQGWSEDLWFTRQARDAGFSIWYDWGINMQHWGMTAITQEYGEAYEEERALQLGLTPIDNFVFAPDDPPGA